MGKVTGQTELQKLTCLAEGIASVEVLAYAHGFQFCPTTTSLKYFFNFQYTLVGSFLSGMLWMLC